jgi:anti-sigma factor RsiW
MNCQQLVEHVTDYLAGALDPDAARRFEAHLEACDGCVAHLEQMLLTLRLLGEIPTASPDGHVHDLLLDAFLSWAASGA